MGDLGSGSPRLDGIVIDGVIRSLDYPLRLCSRSTSPELAELCHAADSESTAIQASILARADQLAAIPLADARPGEPQWVNGWLPALDSALLYTLVADRAPATYLEVGSGHSTTFVRRAINDVGGLTRIVSIDPQPRSEIDALCDEVLREPFENLEVNLAARLQPGDLVFIDNSHRALQNSDATVIFLELLPRLPAGVLVGFHDIFLPDDYPAAWVDRLYGEQYLLAAWLLGGAGGGRVIMPGWYVSAGTGRSREMLGPLWDRLPGVETHAGAFWIETGKPVRS